MNFRPNPLLYGISEDFFTSFKLVITMRDAVDRETLALAVAEAMERYPYFSVSPEKTDNSLTLRENPNPVPVFGDGRCAVLGSEETNGHLLAFGCEENRILLHASHCIADGMGISPLLNTVLYLYASRRYGTEGLCAERISMPKDPVKPTEYCYPFPETPSAEEPLFAQIKAPERAYALSADAFDGEGLYAYHLHVPQKAMMAKANPSDGSPASFLSIMLFRALCALDEKIDLPTVVHIQHQYRAAIGALNNRHSLVNYIPIVLSPKTRDFSLERQNTVMRGQVILGSEAAADRYAVDRLIAALPSGEGVSLAEKEAAMQKYIKDSVHPKTFGISYVGKMDWCGLDQYVEDIHAYIGEKNAPHMLLIEVMTVREDFTINFMQAGRGRRYVDAFIEQLRALDIPVTLVGEERYTLCDTKIPK